MLLLLACRWAPEEPAASCAPQDEVPYDGIDQDCDGADLTDVDGDGRDAVEAGGVDCDDARATVHPDAEETPYDGIDQDCDGADLTDVDGDGQDAESAGGTDCGDGDPSVYAGGTEVDGYVDEDCDGRTDEVEVCGASIQAALDAAERIALIELCPGEWEEAVVLDGARSVTIVGGGALPEDVSWRAPAGLAALTVSDGAELTVEWLALDDDVADVATADTSGALTLSTVGLRGEGLRLDATGQATLSVELCRAQAPLYVYAHELRSGSITLHANLALDGGTVYVYDAYDYSSVTLSNNLFAGGSGFSVHSSEADLDLRIDRNTVVDQQAFSLSAYSGGCPTPAITSNIFAEDTVGRPLWTSYCIGWNIVGDVNLRSLRPTDVSGNVVWNLDYTWLTYIHYFCDRCYEDYYDDWEIIDTGGAEDWIRTSTFADPEFETGEAGSWTPSVTGPAADAGAFSGDDGDWWREVPWEMP